MSANSFGTIFRITTWGESHGKAIGVIIDGCPAGIDLSEGEINEELAQRAPGKTPFTSPRKETDQAELISGVFEGKTTGTPLTIMIRTHNANPAHYTPIKDLLRPGHANATYLQKYGIFDYRGGGRASARETACRVAAGAVAKKLLTMHRITVAAYIKQIGTTFANITISDIHLLKKATWQDLIFCPDPKASKEMQKNIEQTKEAGDSLGGVVEFIISQAPAGLGDPVYNKLEAKLAHGMMSLPATKGFEIGSGFNAVTMKGSEHNDRFVENNGHIETSTNHAGGVLGGISTGMPIIGRVAFKPPSSIKQPMETVDINGEKKIFELPAGSRHDPCVAIRAVPVVESMAALVLADSLLLNRCSKA